MLPDDTGFASLFTMAISLYLDTRRPKVNGLCAVRLSINYESVTRLVSTGVDLSPEMWDEYAQCVRPRCKDARALNVRLRTLRYEAERMADRLAYTAQNAPLAECVARAVQSDLLGRKDLTPNFPGSFAGRLTNFAARKAAGTRRLYMCTLSRMRAFDADVDALTFEDITRDWLLRFEAWMRDRGMKKNASNIHLRNIRAVFNDALDDEVITCYPFRRLKIRPEPTRKRSLSVERLRELFGAEVEPYARQYLDMFKLSFMLCGINTVDLCHLEAIGDGRVEYRRAKTGRLYSVKVEPEALDIINRYGGAASCWT